MIRGKRQRMITTDPSMDNKVLLVDDSADVLLIVSRALSGAGVELITASSAAEGMRLFRENEINLILLDIGLPDYDGFNLLLELQENSQKMQAVPVIFLTGKSGTNDKVTAFSMGADDYIVKPFDVIEFRARVMSKLEKIRKRHLRNKTFLVGDLVFDLSTQRAYDVSKTAATGTSGRDMRLTVTEFRLLHYLARQPSHVFSRAQLLDAVWGHDVHVFDRTVDAHVCALRRKLLKQARLVESIPGIGYSFKPKVNVNETDTTVGSATLNLDIKKIQHPLNQPLKP
ncbi:MAG: response regulator transcription factor [Bdellovibrionota bacterium]